MAEPRAAGRAGALAWLLIGAVLALPALLTVDSQAAPAVLGWRPERWLAEPWRWWSAAWVHLSARHLAANLAGALLVIALGVAARVPPRAALAWALAWPLTHLGLLLQPELTRYGGLSGVLHAGVAVVAVLLARRPARAERALGLAIAAVLAFKIASEAPWRAALVRPPGWDIAIAPLAHATGALAGALLAWLVARPARAGPRPAA